jgi:hypothetical protein
VNCSVNVSLQCRENQWALSILVASAAKHMSEYLIALITDEKPSI